MAKKKARIEKYITIITKVSSDDKNLCMPCYKFIGDGQGIDEKWSLNVDTEVLAQYIYHLRQQIAFAYGYQEELENCKEDLV